MSDRLLRDACMMRWNIAFIPWSWSRNKQLGIDLT
jgi:hypothetical protein